MAGGAARRLPRVTAPALLVVGTGDRAIRQANGKARRMLGGVVELLSVPGTTYPFDGAGTLDRVADAAGNWFADDLRPLTATG